MSFFGHYKLKPIECVEFFNRQEHSAVLTASIVSINVAKTNNKYSTASYTSVKRTYYEVLGQIAAMNEP